MVCTLLFLSIRPPPRPTLFPYTTLFRSTTVLRLGWPAASRSAGSEYTTSTSRSEEHTSELQSRRDLVCRLLLEKKKIVLEAFRNVRPCPRSAACHCVMDLA